MQTETTSAMHDHFPGRGNHRRARALSLCLPVLALCGAVLGQFPERVVEFPPDKSLGFAIMRPWDSHDHMDWTSAGEAKGSIKVPAGMALGLQFRNFMIGSFGELARLAPDGLQELNLNYVDLQEEHLKVLGQLTGLRELALGQGNVVTDDTLAYLSGLKNLEYLDMRGAQVKGPGLAHLAGLPVLRSLSLHITPFNDEGLDYLVQIKSLEYVGLWLTHVSSDGVARLSELPNLKALDFSGNFNDVGCAHVAKLATVERLDLNDNDLVTDEGMRMLSQMPKLRILRVNSKAVTDKGLMAFRDSASIERIVLIRSQTTRPGAEEFRKAKPNCTLFR